MTCGLLHWEIREIREIREMLGDVGRFGSGVAELKQVKNSSNLTRRYPGHLGRRIQRREDSTKGMWVRGVEQKHSETKT